MKAIVCGGRYYGNLEYFIQTMNQCKKWWNLTTIIHGCATGADTMADHWAKANNLKIDRHPANWGLHGKAAGTIRNYEMLEVGPDVVIAFPGGKGTENMITISRRAGVPVFII